MACAGRASVTHPADARSRALRFALTAAMVAGAHAAQATDAPAVPATVSPPPAPQRVEIGANAAAQRRADLAGRQVVDRTELTRHGDTRLVDALQRVPGLTVEARGGNTEIKLGGLGDGRTLVLLNGQPVPQGFSLDNLSLDSIERVEVVRGATVQSSQAIAGTVNLVTRGASRLAKRELGAALASQWGHPQASVSLSMGDRLGERLGSATWGLGLTASREHRRWPALFVQERMEGAPAVVTRRTRTDKVEADDTDALSLNPSLAWTHKATDGRQWQLSTEHVLRHGVSTGGVFDQRTPLLGAPPAQQATDMNLRYRRSFWQGRLQASLQQADGSRTEARLSATWARRVQDAHVLGYSFDRAAVQDSAVVGQAIDRSVVLNLNHQRPLGESHRLVGGVEWEQARRREDRVQTEQPLPGGLPPENLDERFDARVQRRAVYLQDDWRPGARTEAQLGIRIEALETDSSGNVLIGVRQSHRLVGPVARLSVTPDGGIGTFKLGLSRGFRLPTPRDVMPRRYVPVEVSPTAPAMTGNPDLHPERAWSLDGSWQRPMPAWAGELVVSGALRRIEDVILDRLIQQPGVLSAPWLLERFNGGAAWTASLELEARGSARTALVPGHPLQWRASLALNQSRLLDVAGAHPALPGQPPWQLKLDFTQPLNAAWTAQLGARARGASVADLPNARRLAFPSRHSLDASLTWRPGPQQRWRLSASEVWANREIDQKTVQVVESGQPVAYLSQEGWRRDVLWRLAFESAF